jgi:putative NIF3 family GTP cyclohydrolase 1 type 2
MIVLLENRIYFYVIPKEWISVKSGFIEIISELLDLEIIDVFQDNSSATQKNLIGRVCEVRTSSIYLADLLNQIKEKLSGLQLRYLGDLNSPIQKILITLEPLTTGLLKQAKRANIDTIICADYNFEIEKAAEELNLNLTAVTLNIINLGLLKLTQALRLEHSNIDFEFINLQSLSNIF